LQISETRILIRLLRIYFPRISEFGPASEFRGGSLNPPNPPRYATVWKWTVNIYVHVYDACMLLLLLLFLKLTVTNKVTVQIFEILFDTINLDKTYSTQIFINQHQTWLDSSWVSTTPAWISIINFPYILNSCQTTPGLLNLN
jgi:hypothetical protein